MEAKILQRPAPVKILVKMEQRRWRADVVTKAGVHWDHNSERAVGISRQGLLAISNRTCFSTPLFLPRWHVSRSPINESLTPWSALFCILTHCLNYQTRSPLDNTSHLVTLSSPLASPPHSHILIAPTHAIKKTTHPEPTIPICVTFSLSYELIRVSR